MIGFDRISRLIAIAITAALIGGAGLSAFGSPAARSAPAPHDMGMHLLDGAQAEDQPMEQVGEGEGDTETLDQGAPPEQQPSDDVETLDEGAPPAAEPAAVTESVALAAETAAAPAAESTTATSTDGGTVYTAPAPASATGPVLPPGFGTGRVRVSAGRFGFPVGLNECHVGAVTGRAYVGIDCGDEERDVVGHAPTFEDFPFVLEAEFPFESDDAFFSDPFFTQRGDSVSEDDIVVSTARPGRNDTTDSENVVATGNGAVELTQRARDREPRVRTGKGVVEQKAKRQKASASNDNTYVASSNDGGANSENQAKKRSQEVKQSAKSSNTKKDKGKKAKGPKKKREKRRSK